nr:hypothetical protein [Pseudofrankia sp. DC12]
MISWALIGARVARNLTAAGHDVAAHSRSTGVDLLTGAGLDDAVHGADVLVDVTNSPAFDEASVDFFRASVTHLLAAAAKAGASQVVEVADPDAVGVGELAGQLVAEAKVEGPPAVVVEVGRAELVEAGPAGEGLLAEDAGATAALGDQLDLHRPGLGDRDPSGARSSPPGPRGSEAR